MVAAAVLVACGGDSGASVDVLTVSVSPARTLLVGIGETVDFGAVARGSSGDLVSGGQASWGSSDPSVATVGGTGLATAVGSGTTTITATIDGSVGAAVLEVYTPEPVTSYESGVSYLGRNGYVEYIPGELPVILSAPHGGDRSPSEIDDRTYGVTNADRNTRELTLAVRDGFIERTGLAPHVVISHLHRSKLDPNREIVEAAQGSPFAENAWNEFQGFIEIAEATVADDYGRGMYFDMHGHGHEIDRLELGYLLSGDDLNGSDYGLSAPTMVAKSSIRDLGERSPIPFSQLVRGPTSLGGYLGALGVRAVPSPGDPAPGSNAYFAGGYNTRRHGSRDDGEVVSGVQVEHHFSGLRDTDANRRSYGALFAQAVERFMTEHFGFFTP